MVKRGAHHAEMGGKKEENHPELSILFLSIPFYWSLLGSLCLSSYSEGGPPLLYSTTEIFFVSG